MSPKPVPPAVPAALLGLRATDPNGAVWGIDIASGKWSVALGDKKASSGMRDVLRDKVGKWQSETAKPAKPVSDKPLEAGFVMVDLAPGWGDKKSEALSFETALKFEPVTAKLEWREGDLAVTRFKGGKDAGWRSSGTDKITIFHPAFLNPEAKAAFEQWMLYRAAGRLVAATERQIAQQWWSCKEEGVVTWSTGREGIVPTPGPPQGGYSSYSSGFTSQDWNTQLCTSTPAKAFAEKDGRLVARGVELVMEMSKHCFPEFSVVREGEVLYVGSELGSAITLANATLAAPKHEFSAVSWIASGGDWPSSKSDRVSWPEAWQVTAACVMESGESGRSRAEAYMLAGKDAALNSTLPESRVSSDRDSKGVLATDMRWRESRSTSVRAAGPEDRVLAHLPTLKEIFATFVADSAGAQVNREEFIESLRESVRAAYGSVGDGEELDKTPAAAREMWERFCKGAETRREKSAPLLALKAACEGLVAKVATDLDGLKKPASAVPAVRRPR